MEENGVPPYRYFWQPIGNNQSRLSATDVATPTIDSSWGSHNVYYRVTVYDASPVQKVASLVFRLKLITKPDSAELALRDSYYDVLDEPNSMYTVDRNHWDIWRSPDLWNRKQADGGTVHEDPEYYQTDSNYVYTRVRNIGCAASRSHHSLMTLFWTKASTGETWRSDWDGTAQIPGHSGGMVPGGGVISEDWSQLLPVIPPGDTYVQVHGWRPPEPQSFYGQPAQVDVCLLARLTEGPGHPFSIAGETDTVKMNVLRKNNIVTRNLLLTNLTPGNRVGVRQVDVVNGEREPVRFAVQFIADRHINKHLAGSFGSIGRIKIHLGDLYDRWVDGGRKGTPGLIVLEEERAILTDGTAPLLLENLLLQEKERFPVDFEFSLLPDVPVPDLSFDFSVQQFLQNTAIPDQSLDKVYGAVNLRVNTHGGEAARAGNVSATSPLQVQGRHSDVLALYPNPAGDVLKVQYPSLGAGGQVGVYDGMGRQMQARFVEAGSRQTELDVRALPPGLYLVVVRSAAGEVMRKMFTKK